VSDGHWSVRCGGAPPTVVAMVRGRGVVAVDRPDTVSDPPHGRAEEAAPALLTGTYEVHGSVYDRVLGTLPPLLVVPGAAAPVELVAAELAHPWTVAELADRFTRLVGEPPMSYLTRRRLCLAADLLGVAFTRVYGVRPGEHRCAAA
jgi:hypothetical protein